MAKVKTDYQRRALIVAKDNHENNFSSRRGLDGWEDDGLVCVYDNNPYEKRPDLRGEILDDLRRRMAGAGVVELAFASWPPPWDEDEGYTVAMMIGTTETGWVYDNWMEAIREKTSEAFSDDVAQHPPGAAG